MQMLPDASQYLLYEPRFVDQASPVGLWLCTTPEDAASVEVNAACLPVGCSAAENLKNAAAFFEAFSHVLIVGADPLRRQMLAAVLRKSVPYVDILVSAQSAYLGCSSIKELRETYGLSALDSLGKDAEELPPDGLVDMASVENVDIARQPHVKSGIPLLDRMVGGLYDGEVSVWTGKRKEGKSTLLGLLVLSALREGRKVCIYSGELPTWRYKAWLLSMAAGPENLVPERTDTDTPVWTPKPEIARQIDLWWGGKLFQFDNSVADIHRPESLLGLMKYAHRRHGCSIFLVDNLMTVDLAGEDYYRAQSRFVGQLVDFAHETSAHVHLVAHRRKGGGKGGKGDSDEVSGSGDITNRADNTFSVSRISDESSPFDAALEVQANRDFGATGIINLKFDPRSRRYYTGNVNWRCGWETPAVQEQIMTELTGADAAHPFTT